MNNNFLIQKHETIYNAIAKIDENAKSFVFVIDETKSLLGIVTDGDIRRGLLKGVTLDDSVLQVMESDYKFLCIGDSFDVIISTFKDDQIEFLPILDTENKLVNFMTKKHMHILLMSDIKFDLNFNFNQLDESMLEHEIFNRPWGAYKTTFLSQYAQSKVILVNPGGSLSLQEHKRREEHWVIIKGHGHLTIGETEKEVHAGDYVYIPKGCKHRIQNFSDSILFFSEVQLGDYFGEDDIIRFSDIYGRV